MPRRIPLLWLLICFSTLPLAGRASAVSLSLAAAGPAGLQLDVEVLASGLVDGGAPTLRSYDLDVSFDPSLLSFLGVSFDVHLGAPGVDAFVDAEAVSGVVDLAAVSLLDAATLLSDQPDAFRLATLHFSVLDTGVAAFAFTQTLLGDLGGIALPVSQASPLQVVIPEPAAGLLLALGLAGLALRRRSLLAAGLAAAVLGPAPAHANCNIIPTATREYPSELGRVDRPIAAPGDRVAVRVDAFCQPEGAAFDPVAAGNEVLLRFEPPTGLTTDVVVPTESITLAECDGGACNVLLFLVPDTDAELAPAGDDLGLAGPARILVTRDAGATPVAEIATLFEPTRACDQEPEQLFERFTVLPEPNTFTALASTREVRATLDGGDNLLIPMDYTGALRAPPGSPIFSLLEATAANVEAFAGGAPLRLPPSGAVRSFSMLGRPLPPLLRVTATGDTLFGSVDARRSVLRIQRANPGFPDFYDFTDRLVDGRGPIEIPLDTTRSREAAPLPSLRAGKDAVVFARDEAVEGDLNGDGDTLDLVPAILDPATGQSRSTGVTVTEVSWGDFDKPALASQGGLAAFLSTTVNSLFFGRPYSQLRVYDAQGLDVLGSPFPFADELPRVDGRPLVVSDGFVFFRTRERSTSGFANPSLLAAVGTQAAPASPSADGRRVAFEEVAALVSGDTNGAWDVFVRDRDTDADGIYDETGATTLARVSLGPGGAQANGDSRDPDLGPEGRFLAFSSAATNLVEPDANGVIPDVYVRDLVAGTTVRISNDAAGAQLAAGGTAPSIGAGGRFVAFVSGGGIVRVDRDADQDGVFDEYAEPGSVSVTAVASGSQVTIGDDGSSLGFASAANDLGFPKTTPFTEVYWERLGEARRRMPTIDGQDPNGDSSEARISANGRHLAFTSLATNLAPDTPTDGQPRVYVYDAAEDRIEALFLLADTFAFSFPVRRPRISGDGRWVVGEVPTTLLAGEVDTAIADRATGSAGLLDVAASFQGATSAPAISDDGLELLLRTQQGLSAVVNPSTSLNPPDADTRDTVLQVFDAESGFLRAAARTPASWVAVAGGRAAVLSPEAEDVSVTNGDGDRLDQVAQVYDAHADVLTSLGVAAERIAISEEVVCVAVPEAGQPGASNGDGDADDAVLAFWRIGQPAESLVLTGYTVDRDPDTLALGALGPHCVFLSHEADGGTTPIEDDDPGAARRVLAVYSTAAEALVTSATAAERALDFALGDAPDLVAFRSCEAADGGLPRDYNGDGDSADCVMRGFDLAQAPPRLIETERAAQPCTFAACDPFFEPYRVRGVTISFLSRESEQSGPGPATPPHCLPTAVPGACDFDGDGDADDTTIQVFNVRSETAQSFPIVESSPPAVPPFPDTSDEQTLLTLQVPESSLGEDVNGDGVIDDELVVVILGDADEDGSLDGTSGAGEADNCSEVPNPTQVDVDDDGLGDVVCDANLLSFGPQSVVCDVDRNGQVDQLDVDLVFAARGAVAARPTDIRDPNRDGRIDVLDAGLCADLCTYESCRTAPPSSCGLGAELVFALAGIVLARRSRRAR